MHFKPLPYFAQDQPPPASPGVQDPSNRARHGRRGRVRPVVARRARPSADGFDRNLSCVVKYYSASLERIYGLKGGGILKGGGGVGVLSGFMQGLGCLRVLNCKGVMEARNLAA